MKNLSKTQRKLLTLLCQGGRELDTFTLFRRLKIPLTEFMKIVSSLDELKYIRQEDDRIKLMAEGIDNIAFIGSQEAERPWRIVPERFKRTESLKTNMYVPSIRLLDRRTFKKVKESVYSTKSYSG